MLRQENIQKVVTNFNKVSPQLRENLSQLLSIQVQNIPYIIFKINPEDSIPEDDFIPDALFKVELSTSVVVNRVARLLESRQSVLVDAENKMTRDMAEQSLLYGTTFQVFLETVEAALGSEIPPEIYYSLAASLQSNK